MIRKETPQVRSPKSATTFRRKRCWDHGCGGRIGEDERGF